ncbi:MAG: ArsR/SmtB family transcription factor [Xanthobacteraceae bacterium]
MRSAPATSENLDAVFAALADSTRRTIIERLAAKGELAVGDIAEPFDISAPAISRHLSVLENAGLIERRIDKQWRKVRLKREAFKDIESWFERQERFWNNALDRLEALAAKQTPKRSKS